MKLSFCQQIALFSRSLIFTVAATIVVPFYSFALILALLVPLRYRHWIIRTYLLWVMFLLKNVCHIDYQIEGLENIPQAKRGIIFSKHQSTWETFFLPLIFHDPAIIIKKELLWIPFFGWGLAACEPIAINRSDQKNAMQQIITKGKKCLQQGRWILVFPEGTRVAPGETGKYKLGGARLAIETSSFLLPVAHNAGSHWPRRKFLKRPGTIKIVIGPIMESKEQEAHALFKQARDWIEDTMKKIQPKPHQ